MQIPAIQGVIQRRLLINFRVDAEVLGSILPDPFVPLLVDGVGVAGICLIRLNHIRPVASPWPWGLSSENAAHRVAVTLPDGNEGVYIPRRDTNSRLNTLLGGRLFPGVHHHARFTVTDSAGAIAISMRSDDGQAHVEVSGQSGIALEPGSVFSDLDAVSSFFERGSLGFSDTGNPSRYDSLELTTASWQVTPLTVDRVTSGFFEDVTRFPPGTVEFDNALIMRGIEHEWHARQSLYCAGNADTTSMNI